MRACKCHCCMITDAEPKEKYEGKNVHISCMNTYKKQREQQRIDTEEFNLLYDYLIILHNAFEIPSRNIKRIRQIKESKNISFKLILDAYKQCEDKMRWFISEVLHSENSAEDINKAITLMLNDGLNKAVKVEIERIKKEQEQKKQLQQQSDIDMSFIPSFKQKKKDDMDISDMM